MYAHRIFGYCRDEDDELVGFVSLSLREEQKKDAEDLRTATDPPIRTAE